MAASVRSRFGWALTGFGAAVTFVFALIALIAHETLEREVLRAAVRGEVAHVMEHVESTGSATVETETVTAFLQSEQETQVIPETLRTLASGEHDSVMWRGRPHFVAISELPEGRLVVATDISLIEQREREYLLLVIGSTVIFLFLSWRIGRRVAAGLADPLEQLSSRIATFVPGERRQLDMQADAPELQQIIDTFNAYVDRIEAFIEREQHLTGMTSHELRTPLAVIQGASDVLVNRGTLDEDNLKTVKRLRTAARSMAQSVDSILWLAREDDPSFGAGESCDPGLVVLRVVASSSELAKSKGLLLTSDVQSPGTCVAAEPLLEILISNLVRNAIAYTDSGSVCVRFDGSRLSVIDTGPGVTAAELPNLVKPGHRGKVVDQTGSGYGLYTVHQVCLRFGWPLHVEPGSEGGSCFSVDFSAGPTDIPKSF